MMKASTVCAAMMGMVLGLLCFGCGGDAKPAVQVPADCQQFLDKYFAAFKAKDIGKIQEFCAYIPAEQTRDMPQASIDMMESIKRQTTADLFQRIATMFGDLKGYSVVSVTVRTVTTNDAPAARIMGVGTFADVLCKTKFSRQRSSHMSLNLFKETPESEYSVMAWQCRAEL